MLKNLLKIAYRNFQKDSIYSFINVFGLAVGIACSLLIFLYVHDELHYDSFHPEAQRTYRINEFFEAEDGSGERSSSVPFPVAEALLTDHGDLVEHAVRLFNFQAPLVGITYEPNEKEFNERNFFFADSTYHRVFQLTLLKGNVETALNNPNAVIISESIAKKYFGEDEPMGKLLRFQGQVDLVVTGVKQDAPLNSHFTPDFIASFSTLRQFYGGQLPQGWYWNPCWTYLVLKDNQAAAQLEQRFPDFVQKYLPEFIRDDVYFKLQALPDIHLTSHLEFEIAPNSSKANIYLFSVVAVFVLIIASINFMNLSTARSVKRAKEVSVRKTFGSYKYQLRLQFLLESVLMSYLAVVLAVVFAYAALYWFNNLAGKSLVLDLTDPVLATGLLVAGLTIGILSGVYPAYVLTAFNPVTTLRAKHLTTGGFSLRRILVAMQFTISIVLIICTGVAIDQLNFLQQDDTGFKKDHIIMLPVMRTPMAQHYQSFVDKAMEHSVIESITAVEEVVGAKHQGANYQFEGMEVSSLFSRLNVRHNFLETFKIPLLAGRDYSRDIPTDDTIALVVNERLIRGFGWTPEEAVGKPYQFGRFRGQIIGVAKDFNFSSKHEPITPLVLHLNTNPGAFNLFIKYMAVRVAPDRAQDAITVLQTTWNEFLPDRPFEYFFLDNELNNLYRAESNLTKVAGTFSGLALLVACLGLFGLASYNAEQRKKEISIRKVLGSTVSQITWMIFSDYSKLLCVAIVVACPLAYYGLDAWLNTFAYRITITPGIFIIASCITVAIALLTVSFKSVRAANANPVEALKHE